MENLYGDCQHFALNVIGDIEIQGMGPFRVDVRLHGLNPETRTAPIYWELDFGQGFARMRL